MPLNMRAKTSWDFRSSQELLISDTYTKEGYVIEDADFHHLECMKSAIETAYGEFTNDRNKECTALMNAHKVISHEESNDLRLYIMNKISEGTIFQKNYFN